MDVGENTVVVWDCGVVNTAVVENAEVAAHAVCDIEPDDRVNIEFLLAFD